MKKVISEHNKPIKMWLENIEDEALNQASNLANLPFAFKHIALMPDSHVGYGMPIGSILASTDVVVPNAVGVDIGCGMCAQKTSIQNITTEELKLVMSETRKKIPVGKASHRMSQGEDKMPELKEDLTIVNREYNRALKQVGTLGGGNHFVEFQSDEEGFLWVMIHSGSRNLGYSVAKHYNVLAKELNRKWYSSVPEEWGLAYLPLNSEEGKAYMAEMNYCIAFALANRKLMMQRAMECLSVVMGEFEKEDMINKSHNFADWENHFGENVLVHRKGATRARLGELGMIPGSQGTSSYIVKGLGNSNSFESCSHGAGRQLGRKAARRLLDIEKEKKRLDEMGVLHAIRNTNDLDEAPGAYKDIKEVMDNQKDLIEIVTELKPLAVLKG